MTFGRPQQLLAVKNGQAFSINIMLRKGSFQGTLNDYNTVIAPLSVHHCALPEQMTPDELVSELAQGIAALCRAARIAQQRVTVLSVALQGGIEHFTGVVRYCPLFSDSNVNLMALIEQRTGITTRIYNIAHCTNYLLAKRWPGQLGWPLCRGSAVLVMVTARTAYRGWAKMVFTRKSSICPMTAVLNRRST